MSQTIDGASKPAKSGNPLLKMIFTVASLLLATVVGVFLVFQFIQSERDREMQRWQTRLGIVVDSRQADVEQWLDLQISELRSLAENASLQIYMTILHDSENTEDASAEIEYLGNLLDVTANRAGFAVADVGAVVNANVARIGLAGIALVDDAGNIVVSSQGFPPIQGKLQGFLATLEKGSSGISDIYLNNSNNPAMAFAAPVFALQGDSTASSQIGMVVGVKEVADSLYPLLKQPGSVELTAEALLVRQNNNVIEYLSPLKDGTPALKRKLAMDTPNLAAAFAVSTPEGYATKSDYNGTEVLVISRKLPNVAWSILYKINTSEALAESSERINSLVVAFGLIIVLVLAGMAALWYYGTSRRATESSHKFEALATRFEGQRNFMHLVTDSQPNAIAIFDEKGHYRWFNKTALENSGMKRADLFEKHVTAVLGPIEGKRTMTWVQACISENKRQTVTHEMDIQGKEPLVYRSDFTPLPARDDMPAGVLMVSQDITESVQQRRMREQAMRQLVGTLVAIVDRRDPFSANHSDRVSKVSHAIAGEVGLNETLSDSTVIVGSLMNLGKVLVPEEVLTKQGKLTDAEVKLIQQSLFTSADIVKDIHFDGPVYETLMQLQENFDGSGIPNKLAGDDILVTARIAAVANAFVGMVSARAWRSGMDFEKAVDILYSEGGKKYDRAVVIALANYLDNRGGRDEWESFSKVPDESVS